MSPLAAIAPFESLYAEGYVFRRAAEQPDRLVVAVGMLLFFGSRGLVGILFAAASWEARSYYGLGAGLMVAAFCVLVIARTTRNYLKRRRSRGGQAGPDGPRDRGTI
jgi:hypothetical protein